jgi:hypothetical protein
VTGYLWTSLGVLAGLAMNAFRGMVGEEIRDRFDGLPHTVLRLAARRLDPSQRAALYHDDWLPELTYILKRAEARPITRLITGTWFALGILISAVRIARHVLRAPNPQPLPAKSPGSLSVAIADRLGLVTGPVREVLRAAALLGTDFAVPDLAIVLGRTVADLIPAVDEACAAGVLAESGNGLRFQYPLIWAALYDEMPAPVRAVWHRDAGRALAEAGAPPDQVARQMLRAVSGGGGRYPALPGRAAADPAGGRIQSIASSLIESLQSRPRWQAIGSQWRTASVPATLPPTAAVLRVLRQLRAERNGCRSPPRESLRTGILRSRVRA